MKYLLVIGLLVLASCAGSPETRATNALAISCDAHAAALEQVAPLIRDRKLSASNVARVKASTDLVRPLCSKDAVVDPDQAVGIVRSGIELLNSVKSSL
jgi:hypothetical protein